MAALVSAPSPDEIAKFIGEFVTVEFRRTNRAVNGALIASRIRDQFSGFDPAVCGQHWLTPLVRLAEEKGDVIRNREAKHLELIPSKSDGVPVEAEHKPARRDSLERIRVRPDLWKAFLYISQAGSAYFNKDNNRVVQSFLVSGPPDVNLIPIPSISADEQRSWMKEFSEFLGPLPVQDSPIVAPDFWIRFPQWLQQKGDGLELQWRGFRATRVLARIREWANAHHLPEGAVYQSVPLTDSHARTTYQSPPDADTTVRTALVAAIAEMTLDELKDIAIPVRHLLRHFIPR